MYDWVHGLSTRGVVWHDPGGQESDPWTHAIRYEATRPKVFRRIFRTIDIRHQDYVFVDVGCGKGRVLLLAAAFPFHRVIGIELSHELAAVARANIIASRDLSRRADFDVVCLDASTYEFPDEPAVVYLYNPFSGTLMTKLVGNLERSLAGCPRDVIVVYCNPTAREAFEKSEWFEQTADQEGYVIYRSVQTRA